MHIRSVAAALAAMIAISTAGNAVAEDTTLPSGYPYYYGDGGPNSTRIDLQYSAFINKFNVCRYVLNQSMDVVFIIWRQALQSNAASGCM